MSGPKGEGGYVFLSHSHDDIKIVRELRNILEENDMDALCFYLKCLTDDTEVFELIKREIDARKHFVFVESENSRRSAWVSKEREYVRQCPGKIIQRVSLDDIRSSPQSVADRILFNLRIYVSYRKIDHRIAGIIIEEMEKQDYQVWSDDSLMSGAPLEEVDACLREACAYGAVVLILTEHSLDPRNFQMTYEVPRVMELGGFLIPVWVGNSSWKSVKAEAQAHFPCLGEVEVIDGHGDPLSAAQSVMDEIADHIIRN